MSLDDKIKQGVEDVVQDKTGAPVSQLRGANPLAALSQFARRSLSTPTPVTVPDTIIRSTTTFFPPSPRAPEEPVAPIPTSGLGDSTPPSSFPAYVMQGGVIKNCTVDGSIGGPV